MWVKVCGVRDVDTARHIADAGADAIGLNFYAGSSRVVTPSVAAQIVRGLPASVEPIGLFVNASAKEIQSVATDCGLRTLQLHGDEPPELLAELSEFRLIRAFRVGDEGLGQLNAELDKLQGLGVRLQACLVDARVEGAYGGTGRTAPWDLLAAEWRQAERPPLVLAGGLTPENVSEACRTAHPWGVDVAGGVETAPGVKDPNLVRRFIENARAAS